jgi:hypothetical protein
MQLFNTTGKFLGGPRNGLELLLVGENGELTSARRQFL